MKSLLATMLLCLPTTLAMGADLPSAIAARGSLIVAIVPNYPPMEFRNPRTSALTGFDVDLGQATARKLGLKLDWQETSFEQMMPALATGRVDAILSGMSDLAARHETASFVDYLRSGPQFFIQASRAGEFKTMATLCGKSVGASRRTSFPKEIAAWSAVHCAAAPITVVGTNGSADARTQLKEGRIDAAVQGTETLPYVMGLEPGAYETLGDPIASQFTAIALPKSETGLQASVAGALDVLIADGTYKALLVKWHLSSDGIAKATINAGQ
jgi:polar amino acid transport system substrate-binding protein